MIAKVKTDKEKPVLPNTAAPIFIPYCSHTAKEMVPILKQIYRTAKGDQLEFILACRRSTDPRVNNMNHFARDVLFELVGGIFQD